jgi:putative flippase GtrA
MIKKIKEIIKTKKEIITYIIFGALTTLINLIVYYILTNTILDPKNDLLMQLANTIAWIISVLFAYITNKLYVFNSKSKKILKEILSFISSRIITLLIEIFLMYILVTLLKQNDQIIKLLVTIIVIILNYILSKILVFKSKENQLTK